MGAGGPHFCFSNEFPIGWDTSLLTGGCQEGCAVC